MDTGFPSGLCDPHAESVAAIASASRLHVKAITRLMGLMNATSSTRSGQSCCPNLISSCFDETDLWLLSGRVVPLTVVHGWMVLIVRNTDQYTTGTSTT